MLAEGMKQAVATYSVETPYCFFAAAAERAAYDRHALVDIESQSLNRLMHYLKDRPGLIRLMGRFGKQTGFGLSTKRVDDFFPQLFLDFGIGNRL